MAGARFQGRQSSLSTCRRHCDWPFECDARLFPQAHHPATGHSHAGVVFPGDQCAHSQNGKRRRARLSGQQLRSSLHRSSRPRHPPHALRGPVELAHLLAYSCRDCGTATPVGLCASFCTVALPLTALRSERAWFFSGATIGSGEIRAPEAAPTPLSGAPRRTPTGGIPPSSALCRECSTLPTTITAHPASIAAVANAILWAKKNFRSRTAALFCLSAHSRSRFARIRSSIPASGCTCASRRRAASIFLSSSGFIGPSFLRPGVTQVLSGP